MIRRYVSALICAALFGLLSTSALGGHKIEMSVVTDWETVQYFGSVAEVEKFIQSSSQATAMVYRDQLGVELVITRVEIPSDAAQDRIAKHTNAHALLDSLKIHRVNQPTLAASDVTTLLTVRKLATGSKNYAGIATTNGVCAAMASAIVSVQNNGLDYQTIAHEVAHTMGAAHDGESPCENESSTGYIMAPFMYASDTFSQCTIDTIKQELAAYGDCLEEKHDFSEAPDNAGSSAPPAASASPSNGGGGSMDLAWLALLILVSAVPRKYLRK